jgi:hypothetical protein
MNLHERIVRIAKALRPHCFIDGAQSRWDVLQDWKSLHRPWPWSQHERVAMTSRTIVAALLGGERMEAIEKIERRTPGERLTAELEDTINRRPQKSRPLTYREQEIAKAYIVALFGDSK